MLLHHDEEDYDHYRTSNTTRIDQATFTMPHTIDKETKLTLQLQRQKVKRDSYIYCKDT